MLSSPAALFVLRVEKIFVDFSYFYYYPSMTKQMHKGGKRAYRREIRA